MSIFDPDLLRLIEPDCEPGVYELIDGNLLWIDRFVGRGTVAIRLTAERSQDVFTYFAVEQHGQMALYLGKIRLMMSDEVKCDRFPPSYFGVIAEGPKGLAVQVRGDLNAELLLIEGIEGSSEVRYYLSWWIYRQDDFDEEEVLFGQYGPVTRA